MCELELFSVPFATKKIQDRKKLFGELFPVSELQDLAPPELFPVSELQDLAMFNTRNSKIGHVRLPKTENRPCSIFQNRTSAMFDFPNRKSAMSEDRHPKTGTRKTGTRKTGTRKTGTRKSAQTSWAWSCLLVNTFNHLECPSRQPQRPYTAET